MRFWGNDLEKKTLLTLRVIFIWFLQNRRRGPRYYSSTPESGMIKARIRLLLRPFTDRKKKQMACKPGSVRMAFAKLDDYSSGTAVTSCLMRPTQTSLAGPPVLIKQLCPYMVLLRMGFTLPALSPDLRCALTAPFHPYMHEPEKSRCMRFFFCGTFPRVAPAGRYPAS